MMKRLIWLSMALGLAHPALAAVLTGSTGVLATCSSGCTTGAAADSVVADGSQAVFFYYTGSGTTNAKVQQSLDGGTSWVDVNAQNCAGGACTNAGMILGTNGAPVTTPAGRYRVNVTTCTSCTYAFKWYAVNQK